MQKLGQHFLKNPAVIKKIIAGADIKKSETIIEIGPGHGELTIPLAEACAKIGANVVAIEKDGKLAEDLRFKIQDLRIKTVEILDRDALSILKSKILNPKSFKLLGNIPYYITGHLLRTIGELETKPELCIFTIQKEVAERICAEPPKMNRLAASVQFWAEPKIIANVPRANFSPAPKVDSAIIKLEVRARRYEVRDQEKYYATVRMLFAQPRKTILNNLAADQGTDKENVAEKLAKLGIDPNLRPQNLTIEDICEIARVF
jgi:16S rRNA (adenine1518-N6/adenine1519-N6)-dimethyltransferase